VEILSAGLVLAAAVLGAVAILTHPARRTILSFILGVSAGLVGVQIFRIHAFTLLAAVWVCLPEGRANRTSVKHLALMISSALLLASTTLLGDLVNSPTLALQLLALAGSAAIVAARATRRDAAAMLWGLLAISTIGSLVGLLQVFKVIPTDLWHLEISSIGRPTGIYPEPDWLGMFAGLGLILSWRMPMSRRAKVMLCLINLSVFVLAMARAAWVALAVSLAVLAVFVLVDRLGGVRGRSARAARRGRAAAVAIAVLVAAAALSTLPQLQEDLSVRASTMFGTVQEDDISGQARIRQNDSLMTLAQSVPVYGHGLSAAGRVGVWGQIETAAEAGNNVASNWIIGMWVDGAFFAVPLILFLAGLAFLRTRTVAGQGLLFCLACSLFSNAVFFPVTWLLVGLAIVALSRPGTAADSYEGTAARFPVPRALVPRGEEPAGVAQRVLGSRRRPKHRLEEPVRGG
jgi:hypothetical protein